MTHYKPVIGLEVHIELATKSKMFCSCPADHFGKKPNTQVCPTCLGLPGGMPYANNQAIEDVVQFGMAFGCSIKQISKFDRKHYFYPDLPKAFQISQYDEPFCINGSSALKSGKMVRIKRIHMEEDTGKLTHTLLEGKRVSLVDYNRSGVPLMEMVTEPDFESTDEVVEFLKEVQLVVRYLGISSADMEKGSMRLEANVSVAQVTSSQSPVTKLPNYKVELKNINSFKFLEKAVTHEIRRQVEAHESGERLLQETRGYDENKGITFTQRIKEDANDYRYFPEPDLPPIVLNDTVISSIQAKIPELPASRRNRFESKMGLPSQFIEVLISDPARCQYFEGAVQIGQKYNVSTKNIADLMVNKNMDNEFPEPEGLVKKLVELSKRAYAGSQEVETAVAQVLVEGPEAVDKYRNGKEQIIGFLIGMVQKKLKGTGDPKTVQKVLLDKLRNSMVSDILSLWNFLNDYLINADTISAYYSWNGKRIKGSEKIIISKVRCDRENIWYYKISPVSEYVFVPYPVNPAVHADYGRVERDLNPDVNIFRYVPTPLSIYGGGEPNVKVDFLVFGYKPEDLLEKRKN